MLLAVIVILFLLWLLGYGPFEVLRVALVNFNGRVITLWDVIIFGLLVWVIGILPRPFKEIASVLLIIWTLSVLGIIAIAGLSNLLILSILVGLVLYMVSGK